MSFPDLASQMRAALASNGASTSSIRLMRVCASGTALSSTRRQMTGARRLLSCAANANSLRATPYETASGLSTNTTVSARVIKVSIALQPMGAEAAYGWGCP